MSDWRVRALCRNEDPDLFFREDDASIAAAKAVCARCPVVNDCALAGRDEPWGVWAGLETGDRLGLMLLATPEPPPHTASRSCYVSGCDRPECRQANTDWIRAWRDRDRPVTAPPRLDECQQLALEVS